MRIFKILTMLLTIILLFCMLPFSNVNAKTDWPPIENGYGIMIRATPGNGDHEYYAYQIFSGDVYSENSWSTTLSNIKWGKHITNSAKFLEDLKTIKITVTVDEVETEVNVFSDAETANDVADILVQNEDNSELLQKFSEVAEKNVDKSIEVEKSTFLDNNRYFINVPDGGYYLIKDSFSEGADKHNALSKYILEVVKDVDVYSKSDVPYILKRIVDSDLNDNKHNTAAIGEPITFEILGNIPRMNDYYGYDDYIYDIKETLGDGFTLNEDSFEVVLSNEDNFIPWDEIQPYSSYERKTIIVKNSDDKNLTENDKVTYTIIRDTENENKFTIKVNNLKDLELDEGYIRIRYQASLNENAVIGVAGNTNTAYLKYSNNPHNDGESGEFGQTPTETTYTYTTALNINKVDEKTRDPLSNVEFEMYKINESFDNSQLDNAELNGKTKFEWLIENDGLIKLNHKIKTDENGKFKIKGLSRGSYCLVETKEKDGYNNLNSLIGLTVEMGLNEDNTGDEEGKTKKVMPGPIIKPGWSIIYSARLNFNVEPIIGKPLYELDASKEPNELTITIENTKGFELPTTGGIGTTVFTIVGFGAMVIAIVAILKTNKRKK